MKKLALLAIASVALVGCAGFGSLTYSRPIGGGKGYVTLENGGGSIGYRGTFFGAPAKKDGKQVIQPVQAQPTVWERIKGLFH